MIIVGFSGKAENGKTYFANKLKNILEENGYAAHIQPLAKIMKEQAKMLGWNGEKDEKGRRLLQEISWPVKHYHGEDIYAKWCLEQGQKALDEINPDRTKQFLLVDDVRMLAEVNLFTKLSKEQNIPFILVRITRPGWKSKLNEEQLKDCSETQLDDYDFKVRITNEGTPESAEMLSEILFEKEIKPALK